MDPRSAVRAPSALSLVEIAGENMNRLYVPSDGTCSWRMRLAEPSLHWKRGASALELAVSWEIAARTDRGLPVAVAEVLDAHEITRNAQLLFGVPEHRVSLPGGSRASQTDLWAVLKGAAGWISVAVEGKAREPFGPTVNEWLQEASAGKRTRLDMLCQTLGVPAINASDLRYQLFHRTASAVLEATRIGAGTAMLLVHNFYPASTAWTDYQLFVELLGATASRNGICEAQCLGVERLLLTWVDSPLATDADLASIV
jgi:hypothetical protein